MRFIECSTQADVDAVPAGDIAVVRSGRFEAWGSSHVVARDSSHVVARDSSHVVARDSSHVEAWGSSHVEAWGSSHVVARGSSHVEARGSSHVEARDSSHVVAWGSSHVVASKFVAVHDHSDRATITGGHVIRVRVETGQDWCDLHGVAVDGGKAVLFKAVEDDWMGSTKRDITYRPGETPTAPDWDETPQCGGGLHLCAHPRLSRSYCMDASRYVACEVDVDAMVLLDDKVKVPSCRVLHEVTIDGEPIGEAVAS